MTDREKHETRDAVELLKELPREVAPPPELLERVRSELHGAGLLGSSRRAATSGRLLRWAAAVAMLVGTFWLGVRFGEERTFVPSDGGVTATRVPPLGASVQQLGSDYAEAIALLAGRSGPESAEWVEAREVALSTLRGAAEQLSRVPGHDRETVLLLNELRQTPATAPREGWL